MSEREFEFNMEQLIKEIYSRPILWNPKHKDYINKDQRNYAWQQICVVFDENYYNRSLEKQMKMCLTIRRKYKSLRDSYQRERNLQKYEEKAGGRNMKRRIYVYFEQLHFLSAGMMAKKKIARRHNDETGQPITSTPKKSKICSSPKKKMLKRTIELERHVVSTQITANELLNKSNNSPPGLSVAALPSSDPIQNEEDTLFLLSLVKEIQKIPENIRLTAKIDILQTIRRWQARAEEQHHNSTPVDQANRQQIGLVDDCKNSKILKTREHLKKRYLEYMTKRELETDLEFDKQSPAGVTETYDTGDQVAVVKDESIDDTFDELDDQDEMDIVKFEPSESNDSYNMSNVQSPA